MAAARRIRSGGVGEALVVCAALLAHGGAARAGDGVQFARDCTSTYVNEKVGTNEQWAITWSIYGDATGSVLKLDGSAPSFIGCEMVGEDETNASFDCYGSGACSAPPCGEAQWSSIGSGISIPLTFFLPPGVDPLTPFDSCVPGLPAER